MTCFSLDCSCFPSSVAPNTSLRRAGERERDNPKVSILYLWMRSGGSRLRNGLHPAPEDVQFRGCIFRCRGQIEGPVVAGGNQLSEHYQSPIRVASLASSVGGLFTTLATVHKLFQNWEWPCLSWTQSRRGVISARSPTFRMQLSRFSPQLTRARRRLRMSSSCLWLSSADMAYLGDGQTATQQQIQALVFGGQRFAVQLSGLGLER